MSIIGIDLGTTTSEVAYYKNGEAKIIKNVQEGDSSIIPSVVLIEGNNIKVGIKAKNQMIIKPKNTVIEVKRLIGSNKKIVIDGKDYSATEISSMILEKIKNIAEFYIGEKVEEAVITVPANFNDHQRKETKKAAKLAGLKVERIINEPTAAAIAYGLDKLNKDMKILVYDFGGGTIDVSVLELFDGIINVKTSRGNNNLGGTDIDKLVISYIAKDFYNKNKIKLDLKNPRVMSSLKTVSEECKKNLSFDEEYDVIVPYIGLDKNNTPIDLNMTITRDVLEGMCKDIISKTEDIINDALKSANLKNSDIDSIVLVGGTTRMPCIRNMLSKRFGKNKIALGINPDETVATGAAIQAAIKSGVSSKNIIVTDAVSYSLGVEILGGKFDPIIKRDSKLPSKITKTYKTVEDGQKDVEIKIYQGESEYVESNVFINSFELNDIPKGKKGEEIISIAFKYDLNGILDVAAEVISTGQAKEVSLSTKSSNTEESSLNSSNATKSEEYEYLEEDLEFNNILVKELEDDINFNESKQNEDNDEYEELTEINYEYVIGDEDIEYGNKETPKDYETNTEENEDEEDSKTYETSTEENEDEEDYSNIFQEIVQLVTYVNSILPSFPEETQSDARDIMRDMVAVVKEDKYAEVRELEMKLMVLLNIQG